MPFSMAAIFALDVVVTNGLANIPGGFAGGLPGAVIGAISSLLMGEVADALGLPGFEGGLVQTVGTTVTTQLLTNAYNVAVFGAPTTALTAGFNTVKFAANVTGAIGAHFGQALAAHVIIPHYPEGAVGHQFGTTIGGTVGAIVGTTVGGPLGAFMFSAIGSFVGGAFGTFIGDLAGNEPEAHGSLVFDFATHRFTPNVDTFGHSNGGHAGSFYKLAEHIANVVNTFADFTGAQLEGLQTVGTPWGTVRIEEKLHFKQVGRTYTINEDYQNSFITLTNMTTRLDLTPLVDAGIMQILKNTDIIGGDPLMRLAWDNSKAENAAAFGLDLQAAKDYRRYLDDKPMIDALMAAVPESSFTLGWLLTLMKARELGLDAAPANDDFRAGNDVLNGTAAGDFLVGGRGFDMIYGGEGNDRIDGGADGNWLFGDGGNDILVGGTGNDAIHGGTGDDALVGQAADDALYGEDGNDTLRAGAGNDTLRAGAGNDYLDGGAGHDLLMGDDGEDILVGGTGNDTLDGGADANRLEGGDGDDLLVGGAGNDTLTGDAGNDQLHGGAGNDRFLFAPGSGADAVHGFAAGANSEDRIDLTAFAAIRTLTDVRVRATQLGADTVIALGGADSIRLANVGKESLNIDDFVGLRNAVADDFNGDAKSDLLFLNDATHGVAIWQMNGTQVELSPQVGIINAAGGWGYERRGDFNGDGKSDLLMLNGDTIGVAVWQMNGVTVELNPQVGSINSAGGWAYEDVADFNGDGMSDIFFLNDTTHGVAVWQMNGTVVELSPQVGTVNAADGWRYEALADFNGDRKTDILFLNDTNDGVAVWQMNGTQVQLSPQVGTINTAAGWAYADTGDFNGDGKADLLFINETGATRGVAVWQMNGTQIAASPQVGTFDHAAGWHYEDTGDFNGDGKADLLFLNDVTHGVAVWQMNGTQVAAAVQVGIIDAASGWHYDDMGDFNGDGKADLLFLNDTTHGVAVWQMNGTQVEAMPQVGIFNAAAGWHLVT